MAALRMLRHHGRRRYRIQRGCPAPRRPCAHSRRSGGEQHIKVGGWQHRTSLKVDGRGGAVVGSSLQHSSLDQQAGLNGREEVIGMKGMTPGRRGG